MEEDSGLGAVQTIQSQYQASERVNRRISRGTRTLNTSLPQQASENMETDSAAVSPTAPTRDTASETDIGGPATHTPSEEGVYDSDSSEEDFDEKTAALYLSPGVIAVIRRRGKKIKKLREQKRKQKKAIEERDIIQQNLEDQLQEVQREAEREKRESERILQEKANETQEKEKVLENCTTKLGVLTVKHILITAQHQQTNLKLVHSKMQHKKTIVRLRQAKKQLQKKRICPRLMLGVRHIRQCIFNSGLVLWRLMALPLGQMRRMIEE